MYALLIALTQGLLIAFVLFGGLVLWEWRRAHHRTRKAFSEPLRRSWDEAPAPLTGRAAELDAAWRELGYEPLGVLRAEEMPGQYFILYRHPAEPIYGSTLWRGRLAYPCTFTFFPGGGKITTTATPVVAIAAELAPNDLRLIQYRPNAPPDVLDLRHRQTLHAWRAAGRHPLPAGRDLLIPQTLADHEALRPAVWASGGLPWRTFWGILTANPRGVTRF